MTPISEFWKQHSLHSASLWITDMCPQASTSVFSLQMSEADGKLCTLKPTKSINLLTVGCSNKEGTVSWEISEMSRLRNPCSQMDICWNVFVLQVEMKIETFGRQWWWKMWQSSLVKWGDCFTCHSMCKNVWSNDWLTPEHTHTRTYPISLGHRHHFPNALFSEEWCFILEFVTAVRYDVGYDCAREPLVQLL